MDACLEECSIDYENIELFSSSVVPSCECGSFTSLAPFCGIPCFGNSDLRAARRGGIPSANAFEYNVLVGHCVG